MQLLKRRRFSEIFNDTFDLLKKDGKHFFKNYFILNGLPLLFFLIIIYFFTTTFYGLGTYQQGESFDMFLAYVKANPVLFIAIGILTFFVSLIFAIIQYGFVPVYLMLYNQKGSNNFSYKEIFDIIFKKKLGKIIIFIFASILVMLVVLIPFAIVLALSILTLVGPIFVIAMLSLWFNNAFMEYLNSDKGVFACFSYGFDLLKVRFWDYVGAIGLMLLLTSFISGGISMITSIFSTVAAANASNNNERSLLLMVGMIFSFTISQVIKMFVQTVVQLAQGIVFYSAKEEKENISGTTEIDKIGLGE